jgi:hypothetical protein
MSEKLRKLRVLNHQQPIEAIEVQEVDDITDEIEKSLLELKESCDLPTEEVEKAIDSRKRAKYFNFFGKK